MLSLNICPILRSLLTFGIGCKSIYISETSSTIDLYKTFGVNCSACICSNDAFFETTNSLIRFFRSLLTF